MPPMRFQLVNDLIAKLFRGRTNSRKPKKFKWIARDLKPRIDVEDKESLNKILDADQLRKLR
jgi:hypothetical protein